VNDLEIFYSTNKLRAATYGRGVWETDLYSNPSATPFAFFTTAYTSACINVPLTLSDASSNSPSSWTWTLSGGTPSVSTSQNPSVTFTSTGIYTVSLVATNTVGASSPYTTTISVVTTPTASASNATICAGQTGAVVLSTNGTNVLWQGGQTSTTAYFNPGTTTVYGYTVYSGACQLAGTSTVFVNTPPSTPSVTATGNVLSSTPAAGYQWYLNGGSISGATSQSYTATVSGWYSVWVGTPGCQASSSAMYLTVTGLEEYSVFQGSEITPNPAHDFLEIFLSSGYEKQVSYSIKNMLGQIVKTGNFSVSGGQNHKLDLHDLQDGAYILSLSAESSSTNYKFIRQ
ncbi:MAG: hypothetical protein K0S12_1651, partial [Bacteroidetes bacterium]|nr:hypothetical protein [Bacteroidota bacterium]